MEEKNKWLLSKLAAILLVLISGVIYAVNFPVSDNEIAVIETTLEEDTDKTTKNEISSTLGAIYEDTSSIKNSFSINTETKEQDIQLPKEQEAQPLEKEEAQPLEREEAQMPKKEEAQPPKEEEAQLPEKEEAQPLEKEEAQLSREQHVAENKQLRININTAGLEELMKLTGIGEVKAKSIIDYRNKTGIFASIEEIMNVPGIKEGSYSKIRDTITVE